MLNRKILLQTTLGCLLLASATSQAAIIGLQNDITISGTSAPINWSSDLSSTSSSITQSGTTTQMMGSFSMDGVWDYNWNLMADADPFIGGTFSITNTSSITQSFDITFSLPISPSFNDGYKTGSLGLSFSDTGGSSGASFSLTDWSGLIDGATAMNLTTISGPCIGTGCSVTLATITEGPTFFTGPVNSDIGIHMLFDLSAGDSVNFNTSFEVTPVPVPATLWLLGSGLIGLAGFIRRRNS